MLSGSFFWPPATYLVLLGCVFLMAFLCELLQNKVLAARVWQGNNLRTNIQCIRVGSLYLPMLTLDKIVHLSEGSGLMCSCMAWWFQMKNDEDNLPNYTALSNLIQLRMQSKHINILIDAVSISIHISILIDHTFVDLHLGTYLC